MNQPERPDDRQHRVRAICGNGLRADIWPGFKQRFGIERVAEFYGSTEGNIGTLNLDDTVGSVGRLLFGGVLVRWDEARDDFVRGRGRLSRQVQGGRARRAARPHHEDARASTAITIKNATQKKIVRDAFKKGDAWFNTGDLLRMDEKRRLFFVDRMGDTFRWKGENVSTFEVQEQVSSWPPATEANATACTSPAPKAAPAWSRSCSQGRRVRPAIFRQHVDSDASHVRAPAVRARAREHGYDRDLQAEEGRPAEGRLRPAERERPALLAPSETRTNMSSSPSSSTRTWYRAGFVSRPGRGVAFAGLHQRARLADVEDPQPASSPAVRAPPRAQALRRLAERLVGEPERAPVHRDEVARAERSERLARLLGVHVLRLHEPARLVARRSAASPSRSGPSARPISAKPSNNAVSPE